jgi:hypothetical protein
MSISRLLAACIPVLLLAGAAAGCGTGGDLSNQAISAQDSAATAAEVRASLAGDVAPGAQAYSYRGLYAGIPRSRLEARTFHLAPGHASACQTTGKLGDELTCEYDVRLGPDSAPVHVQTVFGADGSPPTGRVAREVTVTRELPLDVDGVRVAQQLSDAFARQTALLDRRDATFGHHQAQVRMGTMNGARLNYVDLTVMPRGGREILAVKMSRTGTTKPPKAAPTPAAKSPQPKSPQSRTTSPQAGATKKKG